MLRIFAEGLLSVYLICCFIFLVVGNIFMSWSWIKNFEKRRRWGPQYYYLEIWGALEEHSEEELRELRRILEQYEKEQNEDG